METIIIYFEGRLKWKQPNRMVYWKYFPMPLWTGYIVRGLVEGYHVSTKSISRSINDLRLIWSNIRIWGEYRIIVFSLKQMLSAVYGWVSVQSELFALIEVFIRERAFSRMQLLILIYKLKSLRWQIILQNWKNWSKALLDLLFFKKLRIVMIKLSKCHLIHIFEYNLIFNYN